MATEWGSATAEPGDEPEVADPAVSLSRARVQIARLERTVAELLLKNEQLRQQVQRV